MPWVQVNFLGGQTWTHTQYPLNLVAIKIYIIVLGAASHVLFPPLFFRPNGWQHPCAALGHGVGMLIRKSSWGCSMPQFRRLLTHGSSKNINPICLPSSILELLVWLTLQPYDQQFALNYSKCGCQTFRFAIAKRAAWCRHASYVLSLST